MINIERLLDIVNESFESTFDYHKSSAAYLKKYGCGVYLDKVNTPEQRHIAYAYHASDRDNSIVCGCVEVLGLNADQTSRLYIAARAVRNWYQITNWEQLLPETVKDRLAAYIMG